MASVEDTLNRFRSVIAEQTEAIKELRAENERLQMVIAQSADAMTILQAIYTDPSIKPEIRAAAAKAALPHQHPKLLDPGLR
jgi:phage shock protein A